MSGYSPDLSTEQKVEILEELEVETRLTKLIAWVWDVYDRDQQRALRLSGEEPAGKAGRDPWAAADDLVLRKIAQAGLSGLSAMVNGTGPGGSAASSVDMG